MKTVDQKIFEFVEDQEHHELITEKGIVISVEDDHVLAAEFTLEDIDDAQLSICFCCEQSEFVKKLAITRLPDIYDLTPRILIEFTMRVQLK